MHRAQIRDACLTIRGWDVKISNCLDSLDEVQRKFRSQESIMADLTAARAEIRELIAGQQKMKNLVKVLNTGDWDI